MNLYFKYFSIITTSSLIIYFGNSVIKLINSIKRLKKESSIKHIVKLITNNNITTDNKEYLINKYKLTDITVNSDNNISEIMFNSYFVIKNKSHNNSPIFSVNNILNKTVIDSTGYNEISNNILLTKNDNKIYLKDPEDKYYNIKLQKNNTNLSSFKYFLTLKQYRNVFNFNNYFQYYTFLFSYLFVDNNTIIDNLMLKLNDSKLELLSKSKFFGSFKLILNNNKIELLSLETIGLDKDSLIKILKTDLIKSVLFITCLTYLLTKLLKINYKKPQKYSKSNNDSLNCIFCYQNIKNIVFYPCRHLLVCDICRDSLPNRLTVACPICRNKIKNMKKVYFN